MRSVFNKDNVIILIVVASKFVVKFTLSLINDHYHVIACAIVSSTFLILVMNHLDFMQLSSNYWSLVLAIFLCYFIRPDIASASL